MVWFLDDPVFNNSLACNARLVKGLTKSGGEVRSLIFYYTCF